MQRMGTSINASPEEFSLVPMRCMGTLPRLRCSPLMAE